MKALNESLEGVRTLALFDAAGTMIASSRPEIVGQNFADRAYFKLPRTEKNPARLYVSAPLKRSWRLLGHTDQKHCERQR